MQGLAVHQSQKLEMVKPKLLNHYPFTPVHVDK